MKKIFLSFALFLVISGGAVAQMGGGFVGSNGGGVSLVDIINSGLFAVIGSTNTFVKDQKINDAEVLSGGTYSGMRLQTTERASYCIGPSDGQSKEFCFSGGNLLQIHGSNGSLYDGISTGNQVLASDPGLNRHWWAPTGNTVMVGGTGTPETSFMVGSHLRNASTFLVDTTNDWTKHLPISAPAAGECDDAAEKGRMYYDSTSDEFKYCNGTAWEGFADGNTTAFTGLTDTPANYTGAAGKALRVNAAANAVEFVDVGTANVLNFKYEFDCGADSVDFFNDATIELSWDESARDLDIERVLTPTSGDVQAICEVRGGYSSSYYKETDLPNSNITNIAPANGPGPGDWMDCVIAPEADTAYPSYEISFHNVGDSVPSATNCVVNIKKVL